MDFSDPAQRRVFFDVHSGLPRTSHRNTHRRHARIAV
jgi:hypothetical protein